MSYRIIYCHDDTKQPWYILYADDIRRALMAGIALADNAETPHDAIVETPDGWLFFHADTDGDGRVSLEPMDAEGADKLTFMIEQGMIVDHPLNGSLGNIIVSASVT